MTYRHGSSLSSLIAWLFLWSPASAFALETEDVVRLHASGYREEEILEVLAATQSEFMLSAREVVYLSRSGVSDAVVQSMLVSLPLQPAATGNTLDPGPVRLMFTRDDLDLLVQNQVPEPVVVTFIETRDMAFALDIVSLTALRNSGLGLDALQVLVEKSAAGLPAPMAPPPVYASSPGSGGSYFFGRAGYSTPYYDEIYYSPSRFSTFYGDSYYPWQWGFYGGYRPFYASYFPAWAYGWGGHSFYCPRDRHHHGRDHDGDGHANHGGWDGKHGNGHGDWPGDGRSHGGNKVYFGTGGKNTDRGNDRVTAGPNRGGRDNQGSGRGTSGNSGQGRSPVVMSTSSGAGRGVPVGRGGFAVSPRTGSGTGDMQTIRPGNPEVRQAPGSSLFAVRPGTSPGPITKAPNLGNPSGGKTAVSAPGGAVRVAQPTATEPGTWNAAGNSVATAAPVPAVTAASGAARTRATSLAVSARDGSAGGRAAFRSTGGTPGTGTGASGRWGQER